MDLFRNIATACQACRNCQAGGNDEWAGRWSAYLDKIERECLPSGAGFDAGTRIDREKSGLDRVVFVTAFHVMNADGYYTGWQDYTVIMCPTFSGVSVAVKGRDHDGLKDYVGETFAALDDTAVPFDP